MKNPQHKNTMFRIAFGSKARVGKDTATDYIIGKLGGVTLRIADPVYDIAKYAQARLGLSTAKNPAVLQAIGTALRNALGEDIWINAALAQTQPEGVFVVPDMRFENEFTKLATANFITCRIERADRIIDRDPNHPSEIGCDQLVAKHDYVIHNDYTPDWLYSCLDGILAERCPLVGPFRSVAKLVVTGGRPAYTTVIGAYASNELDAHFELDCKIEELKKIIDFTVVSIKHFKV